MPVRQPRTLEGSDQTPLAISERYMYRGELRLRWWRMRFLRVLLLRERMMMGSMFSWSCVMVRGGGRMMV